MSHDPTNPKQTDVWSQDHRAPFANRTITFFFSLIAIAALIGAFLMWPFSSDTPNSSTRSQNGDTNLLVNIDPSTGEEVGVLAKIFNDVTKGTKASIPEANSGPRGIIGQMAQLEVYYNELEAQNDEYRQSFNDALNSDVIGSKGEKAGKLHDIIINKDTGEARAVIISEDDQIFDNELAALKFQNVRVQENDGDVQMAITETRLDQKREFDYTSINNDRFISLKNLKNGQIIDDHGKYVGEIDALIYQNAEVQDLYFLIKPSLVPAGEERLFKMPYENINVVKSNDGYDVQLSTQDTEALATALYQ